MRARRQVFIVGWDLDGRIALTRPPADDGAPDGLRDLIDHIARQRSDLDIYILLWDYTVLYAGDRQWLPAWDFDWSTPSNVRFALDNKVPVGGSHHQKIVAIDDRLAFVGGLDLTRARWDTRSHDPDDPRRIDHAGDAEPAFHDVQLAIDGDAECAVGDLCRDRWRMATGDTVGPATGSDGTPWPDGLDAAWRDVGIGVARTLPEFEGRPQAREVLALYQDAIAAARESIYLENQFLAAGPVAAALADRLAEPEGPDVVIVTQRGCASWMEEQVMGLRRAQILHRLHECDRHGRLRVLGSVVPGLSEEQYTLHSKVGVFDDRLVRIGSANLNNRSMGYDSECDLAIACDDDEKRAAARVFRDGLIAEHCGVTLDTVEDAIARCGSLAGALDALLRSDGRRLVPLPIPDEPPETVELLTTLGDPEKPISASDWLKFAGDGGGVRSRLRRRRIVRAALATLVALTGVAAWRLLLAGALF